MTIPQYVFDLLTGYNGEKLMRQITAYGHYPDCIPGYLYRIGIKRYTSSKAFDAKIQRFAKWCARMNAEVIIHTVTKNGWGSFAVLSITDPVALALEKAPLVERRG